LQNEGKTVRILKLTLVCCEIKYIMVQIEIRTIFAFQICSKLCQTDRNRKNMISAGIWENLQKVKYYLKNSKKKHKNALKKTKNSTQTVMNSSKNKKTDWKIVKTERNFVKKDNIWKIDKKTSQNEGKTVRILKLTLVCCEIKYIMVQIEIRTIFAFQICSKLCQTDRNRKNIISAGIWENLQKVKYCKKKNSQKRYKNALKNITFNTNCHEQF
jgi:hypothetical protein